MRFISRIVGTRFEIITFACITIIARIPCQIHTHTHTHTLVRSLTLPTTTKHRVRTHTSTPVPLSRPPCIHASVPRRSPLRSTALRLMCHTHTAARASHNCQCKFIFRDSWTQTETERQRKREITINQNFINILCRRNLLITFIVSTLNTPIFDMLSVNNNPTFYLYSIASSLYRLWV